jgi:hypothetical protein
MGTQARESESRRRMMLNLLKRIMVTVAVPVQRRTNAMSLWWPLTGTAAVMDAASKSSRANARRQAKIWRVTVLPQHALSRQTLVAARNLSGKLL